MAFSMELAEFASQDRGITTTILDGNSLRSARQVIKCLDASN
jgi:hypothetical protein